MKNTENVLNGDSVTSHIPVNRDGPVKIRTNVGMSRAALMIDAQTYLLVLLTRPLSARDPDCLTLVLELPTSGQLKPDKPG